MSKPPTSRPMREVRASYSHTSLIVYQAYSSEIADPALSAQKFVPPFKAERMTWIKPSFLWMMYRAGWGTKPGQNRILAIEIDRAKFDEALMNSCLSHFDASIYASNDEWENRKRTSDVRVQWDPERDLALEPLSWRSLQVGLGGRTAVAYANDWIRSMTEVTDLARAIKELLDSGDPIAARALLPAEDTYPLPPDAARAIGVDPAR